MLKVEWIRPFVLRLLGCVLLMAAALKSHQLLTESLVSNGIWNYRPLLILQVELESALGIWLLSGPFRSAGWLAAIACFGTFSLVTLYKGLTGAESCDCFGSVHVNPWVTLLPIDLPAVAAPAHGQCPPDRYSACTRAQLTEAKEWFVTTPTVVLLVNAIVKAAWERSAPDLDATLAPPTHDGRTELTAYPGSASISALTSTRWKGGGRYD